MLPCRSAVAVLALLASGPSAAAEGPCDILGAAGNPCVAAHSTVRALFGHYSGPLYMVARKDGRTIDVAALEAGGFANVTGQDEFCAAGDCNITKVHRGAERRVARCLAPGCPPMNASAARSQGVRP